MYILKSLHQSNTVIASSKVTYKDKTVLAVSKGNYIYINTLEMKEIEKIYVGSVVTHILPVLKNSFICFNSKSQIIHFHESSTIKYELHTFYTKISTVFSASNYFLYILNDKNMQFGYINTRNNKEIILDNFINVFYEIEVIDIASISDYLYVLHKDNKETGSRLSIYKYIHNKFIYEESHIVDDVYKIFHFSNLLIMFDNKYCYKFTNNISRTNYEPKNKEAKNTNSLRLISKDLNLINKNKKVYEKISTFPFDNIKIIVHSPDLNYLLIFSKNRKIVILDNLLNVIDLGYLNTDFDNIIHLEKNTFFATSKKDDSIIFRILDSKIKDINAEKSVIIENFGSKNELNIELEAINPRRIEKESQKYERKKSNSEKKITLLDSLETINDNVNIRILKRIESGFIDKIHRSNKKDLIYISQKSKELNYDSVAKISKKKVLELDEQIKRFFVYKDMICVVTNGKTCSYHIPNKGVIRCYDTEIIHLDFFESKFGDKKQLIKRVIKKDGLCIGSRFIKTDFKVITGSTYKNHTLLYGKKENKNVISLYRDVENIKLIDDNINVSYMLVSNKHIFISTYEDDFYVYSLSLSLVKKIKFNSFKFGCLIYNKLEEEIPHFITSQGEIYAFKEDLEFCYSTMIHPVAIAQIKDSRILISGDKTEIFDVKTNSIYSIPIFNIENFFYDSSNLYISRDKKIYKVESGFISKLTCQTKDFNDNIRFVIDSGDKKISGITRISSSKEKNKYKSFVKITKEKKKINKVIKKYKFKDMLIMDGCLLGTNILVICSNYLKEIKSKLTLLNLSKKSKKIISIKFTEHIYKIYAVDSIIIGQFLSKIIVWKVDDTSIYEICIISGLKIPKITFSVEKNIIFLYVFDLLKGTSGYKIDTEKTEIKKILSSSLFFEKGIYFSKNTHLLLRNTKSISVFDSHKNIIIAEFDLKEKIVDMYVGFCTRFRDRKCLVLLNEWGSIFIFTSLIGIVTENEYQKLIKLQRSLNVKSEESSINVNYLDMETLKEMYIRNEKQYNDADKIIFCKIISKIEEIY